MIPLLYNILFVTTLCLTSMRTAAQQFQGSFIYNSLTTFPGAEITFWNILDAHNKNTTLINYSSFNSTNERLPPANVKRVVIFIHGLNRDPWNYMSNMLSALRQTNAINSSVSLDNVQIVCPYFTNGDDKNISYPWNYSAPVGGYGSYSNVLVWPGSEWIGGREFCRKRRNRS